MKKNKRINLIVIILVIIGIIFVVSKISKNNNISAYFANIDYIAFIEYPILEKEYNSPLEVLESELSLSGCDAGIMYENIGGEFKEIAFLNLKEKIEAT